MEIDSFAVVYLHSPRERWWGLLRALTPAGVTLRGVSLESFESWMRGLARKDGEEIFPSTVFFPMTRVERIYEDESQPGLPSQADRVRETSGREARDALAGLESPLH